MTKDEELAMDLALRSLKELVPDESDYAPAIQGQRKRQEKAITAIKQARSAPVQEPVAWMYEDMMGLVGVRVQKEKPIVVRPVTPLCLCTPPAAQRQWTGLTDEQVELVAKWLETQAVNTPTNGPHIANALRYVGAYGITEKGQP